MLQWELVALLVFFLYLAVRWQYVRRPWAYLIGVAGLLVVLAGRFFGIVPNSPRGVITVMNIFNIIGGIIALAGGILATFGGNLDRFGIDKPAAGTTPPPPQA